MKNSALNITFLCVFVAVFIGALFLIKAQFNVGEVSRPDIVPFVTDETTLVPVALAEYVNVHGEKWKLARGNYEFEVSAAADVYPQFVSGSLDPLDVEPGETQKMRVVINSTSALVEVVAEITHDKGKDTVPLRLVSAGAVSRAAQFQKDFFFDERGILTTREEWAVTHKDNSASLVASVEAQSIRQYVYEGEWVVHDTHKTTYNTVFRVKDDLGKSNFLTLAWSDPVCTIISGLLSGACALSSPTDVDGVDGFNLTIGSGASISLSNGATFAYAPGNSIMKSGTGGAIVIQTGTITKGKVEKKYVYYKDADLDGYPEPSATRYLNSAAASGTNYIRMPNAPGTDKRNPTLDCYDGNVSAKPGQTAFFSTDRGDGSFDYNCDNLSEHQYFYVVDGSPGSTCYSPLPAASNPVGKTNVLNHVYQEQNPVGPEAINISLFGIATFNSVNGRAADCGTTFNKYSFDPCSMTKGVNSLDGFGFALTTGTSTQNCR